MLSGIKPAGLESSSTYKPRLIDELENRVWRAESTPLRPPLKGLTMTALFTVEDIKRKLSTKFELNAFTDIEELISDSSDEIYDRLETEWWPQAPYAGRFDRTRVTVTANVKNAALFHCLYFWILPRLSDFTVEPDKYQSLIVQYENAYHSRFARLRRLVSYDDDGDGVIQANERIPTPMRRIR